MSFLKKIWQARERRQWRRAINKLFNQPAGSIMTPFVNTIRSDDSLLDCINIMIGEQVSCLVVEEKKRPIGIITERDFLLKAPLNPEIFKKQKVSDLMSSNVITINPNDSINSAELLMKQNKIRKLVVTENDEIKGILSQTDLVKAVEEQFTQKVDLYGSILCENIMNKVIRVTKNETFEDVRKKMAKNNIGSILVTNRDEVLGVITEYDIIEQLARLDKKLPKLKVHHIMTDPVKCVASDLNIFEANKIMLAEGVRRLPVLVNKKLAGIITQTDLCHQMFSFLRDSLNRIEKQDFGDLKVRVETRDQTIVYQKCGALMEFSLE
ncbi:CBS domain-containing protein [Candidatus Woesearchaeota archaeon]|nr:MAG: CBS domain-containing protein [Candidatus Woesearchaeota archaeon]